MKIHVIGLGHVGLTLSAVLLEAGHHILGSETNRKIINSLKGGKAHFLEPSIDEIISKHIEKRLIVFEDHKSQKLKDCNACIITVGTPLQRDSYKPDLNPINSALEVLKSYYSPEILVVLRSTVPPGFCRNHVLKTISSWGYNENEVLLSFCPERTMEGAALKELVELPQIIGSNNEESQKRANKLFRSFNKNIIKAESLEQAELVKLFNNTYRDFHFAIGNIFSAVAKELSIPCLSTIELANQGYERSKIPLPGPVGGPCLSKDPYLLASVINNIELRRSLLTGREFNSKIAERVVNHVTNRIKLKSASNSVVFITGIAFKGQPATNDLRASVAVDIIKAFQEKRFERIVLHDFICTELEIKNEFPDLKVEDDIYKGISYADIIIVCNNNKYYTHLNSQKLAKILKKDAIALDLWNIMPKEIKLFESF